MRSKSKINEVQIKDIGMGRNWVRFLDSDDQRWRAQWLIDTDIDSFNALYLRDMVADRSNINNLHRIGQTG